MHVIQKHIMRYLTYQKRARFGEMRPARIDSNLYNYHLKSLIRDGLVEKTDKGYRLSVEGLKYVDQISVTKFEQRRQPKIITMLVSFNEVGEVLLWPKKKQPFIGAWSLPSGKLHMEDMSLDEAVTREAIEKVGAAPVSQRQVGICYVRARINGEIVSYILAHVFVVKLGSEHTLHEDVRWCDAAAREQLRLLPATEQIIRLVQSDASFFFTEFDIDW
jgi:ADP-ribose pyrophosphatase YjhB (NUDIX family)